MREIDNSKDASRDNFGEGNCESNIVARLCADYFCSADCKRGRRKGATSKNVKNRQKVSKSFSTLFDNFRTGQKTSKIVKKCQKVFRHFSTIFARHLFSGPFCNPLICCKTSRCLHGHLGCLGTSAPGQMEEGQAILNEIP